MAEGPRSSQRQQKQPLTAGASGCLKWRRRASLFTTLPLTPQWHLSAVFHGTYGDMPVRFNPSFADLYGTI